MLTCIKTKSPTHHTKQKIGCINPTTCSLMYLENVSNVCKLEALEKIQFLNQWYLTFRKKTFFFFFKKNTISWVNECWLVYGNTHGTSLSGFFYRLKVFHNWTFKTKKGGKETEKKKKRERRKMVVFLRWKKSDAWKAEISVKLMT